MVQACCPVHVCPRRSEVLERGFFWSVPALTSAAYLGRQLLAWSRTSGAASQKARSPARLARL